MKTLLSLLVLVFFSSCDGGNKTGKAKADKYLSNSGTYTALVTIEKQLVSEKRTSYINSDGKEVFHPEKKTLKQVWVIRIQDKEEKIVYEDKESKFRGKLMVYVGWDDQDQFWLFNSDDGRTWKWYQKDGSWIKEEDKLDSMPKRLLPDYAQ